MKVEQFRLGQNGLEKMETAPVLKRGHKIYGFSLPKENPHLQVISEIDIDGENWRKERAAKRRAIKKNVVTDLKKEFPDNKFSTRTDNDSLRIVAKNEIEWDTRQKFSLRWENYKTDVTGDFRDPCASEFNNLFGGYKYVFFEVEKEY